MVSDREMSKQGDATHVSPSSRDVCFFTVATGFYQNFVPAYVWFVQESNPGAACEIVVDNLPLFDQRHGAAIEHLRQRGEVVMRELPTLRRPPLREATYRFVLEPLTLREFTYIGDVDILMLENAMAAHREVFAAGHSYSNMVRQQSKKLTGLHFTRTADHYPLPNMATLIKRFPHDEELLYALVESQGRLIEDETFAAFRPDLGIHLSMNRLPFGSPGRPGWGLTSSYLTALRERVNSADFGAFYAACSEDARAPLQTAIGFSEMWSVMGSTPIPEWQQSVRDL